MMRYTHILFGLSLMIAAACAPIDAQVSVYHGNNNAPNIAARIAIGDSYHEATPDNQYVLMAGSEGVLVLRRNQSDNQGRPIAQTFLPHPGMATFVYFYSGTTKYVATFGQHSLRIFTWNATSGPQTHTGTVYSTHSTTSAASITSIGAILVGDGEGGLQWMIALGSSKPSKVYLFTLNGAPAGEYDAQGGSGVYAIASDPYNNYQRLAVTGDGGLVSIFQSSGDFTSPLTISAKLTGGRATLTHVAFVPTYTPGVVALGSDGRLYYWNINSSFYPSTPKAIIPLSEMEPLTSLRFTPNGYAMIAGILPYAYMVQMPTTSQPERVRFTGARPLVTWDRGNTLAEIGAYAMRLAYTTPLTSNRMLATPAAAYMDYKDAPWDVSLNLGVVPLASCVASSGTLAVFTTTNRRIVLCAPGYVSSGTSTNVAAFNLTSAINAPIHSIAYLGQTRNGDRYFVYAFGDSRLGIGYYRSGTPSVFQHVATLSTPSDVRGALLVDALVTDSSTTTVACASPTDGTVLMYRWQSSNPTVLTEYFLGDDSDKLSVGYVIRDVKIATNASGANVNVGGAIRRAAFFTQSFDLVNGFSGRTNTGSTYDGLKFAWNPTDPTKFALISYGSTAIWIDVPFSGPLGAGYRPEINRGRPTQIQYYDGQGVLISFGRFMEGFRRVGNNYQHTGTIVPERIGSFTTLSYGFAVGGHSYAIAGVSNGSASFVLPEAVLVTDSPISVPFSYNFAYAQPTFYTLSNNGSSSRYVAIAHPTLISPRPAGTSILRLDASSPAGYTVERVLPGSYFLNPYPQIYHSSTLQLVHAISGGDTHYYRLTDIITNPDTATPLGTISGVHHRFSFNGQYCITQSGNQFRVYQWNNGWLPYGQIPLPSGQGVDLTRCYINDSGQYAVVFRDYYDGSSLQWHQYADVYMNTSGTWTLKWTLNFPRLYPIFNFDHGSGSYSDYEPFVFIPGTTFFCMNYVHAPNDYRFGYFDAAAASMPTPVVIGPSSPSYTYGFLKNGASVYIFREISDSQNGVRMAIYSVSNPTTPLAEFGRETNRSSAAQRPFVGNEGFGLFTNYMYGVIFNY